MAYQPKSYRKFLAGSVSAALVATAVGPVAANAASFSDVDPNDSHAANINALVELGYIKGFTDGTFKPYQSITRGQVAKIFARILKDQGFKVPEDKKAFDDVPVDSQDQELVEAAAIVKAAGVMTGSGGKLNPAQPITRQQMAKVLVEAFDLTKPADFTSKITDLDKADASFRDYIQTLEANGVTVVTEYRPTDSVTRAAFASFVKRAMDASATVTADDITEVKVVDENTLEVTFNGELKDVKAEDFTIEGVEIESVSIKAEAAAEGKTTVVVIKTKTKLEEGKTYTIAYKGKTTDKAKVEVPVVTPKVESVSAINVNKIKVTFNKPIDTTKAKFEVKRGTVTEDVKVTWNEAKTEAVLEKTAGNFIEAEYTVTVSGVEGLQNASQTVKVEAEKVVSIEIANEKLQKSSTAPLNIKFINQYGEEATVSPANVTITAYNQTAGNAVNRVAGQYQLDASGEKVGDKVLVTVVYNGLTATKALEVVPQATVGSVTLGQAVLPEGKTMFTPSGTTNVELTYTATNTLGEEYKLTAADLASGAVQFFSSDSSILDTADISIDANNKIKIAKFKKAGTVTLTVLTPATGQTSKVTITVNEDAGAPYAVALGKTNVQFAAGSTNPIYVDLTVTDKYGNKIEPKDLKPSDYTFSFDNNTVVDSVTIETAGDNQGKLKITPKAGATKGNSATVTVTVNSTGQKASLTVTASDAAVPTVIDTKKDTTVTTNMLTGATQTLEFDVKDQYGTTYSTGVSGYTVEYSTSDSNVLQIVSTETGDAINNASVDIKAVKAGTATIKATLKKDGVAIAEKSYTITIAQNDSTKVAYSVADIPVLYKDADVDADNDGAVTAAEMDAAKDAGYAKEVKVIAKDANGAEYVVPTSAIVSVSSNNPEVFVAKASDGKYYVATDAVAATDKDVTATLSITINADDTVKTLTKDVTISKDAPKAASIAFKDDTTSNKDAKDVTEITITDKTEYANLGGATIYTWLTDQFGGTKAVDENDVQFTIVAVDGISSVADDTVDVDPATGAITITDTGNNTAVTKDGAKFRLVAIKDGVSDYITVTVTNKDN
jgi:trimeric autotransporter adhesin